MLDRDSAVYVLSCARRGHAIHQHAVSFASIEDKNEWIAQFSEAKEKLGMSTLDLRKKLIVSRSSCLDKVLSLLLICFSCASSTFSPRLPPSRLSAQPNEGSSSWYLGPGAAVQLTVPIPNFLHFIPVMKTRSGMQVGHYKLKRVLYTYMNKVIYVD